MRNTLLFIFLLCFVPGYGQVKTTFVDQSDLFRANQVLSVNTLDKIPLKTMPYVDVEKLLQRDAELEGMDVPFNIGYVIDVNFTVEDGVWEETSTERIWRMRILSEGAYTLNFTFSKLHLAPDAELYIYNRSGSMIYGPVKQEDIFSDNLFPTDLLSGEESIIELKEPLLGTYSSELEINQVVHGYVDIFNTLRTRGIGQSDPCNVNIFDYPEWMDHGTAIGSIVFINPYTKNQSSATGALINNTRNDKKGYFLTAFHNIDIDSLNFGVLTVEEINRVTTWLVRFHFMPNADIISLSGAVYKAGWVDTDFALVELTSNPTGRIEDVPVSRLGWSRTPAPATNGIGIHHPRGDYKKISITNSTVPLQFYGLPWSSGLISPNNSHWNAVFDIGGAQPGSSGSPLLNQNGLIIGQLHGGNGVCKVSKYYGRFDLSWEGGGTPETRLKDWLDPIGTNPMSLERLCRQSTFQLIGTINQTGCSSPVAPLNLTGTNQVCSGVSPISIRLSTNRDMIYVKNVNTVSNYKLTKSGIRNYILELNVYYGIATVEISDGCYSYTLRFQVNSTYSYNYIPEGRRVVIDFDQQQSARHKVSFANVSGAVVKTVESWDHHTEINVSNLQNGVYYMTIYDDNKRVVGTEKIMVTTK